MFDGLPLYGLHWAGDIIRRGPDGMTLCLSPAGVEAYERLGATAFVAEIGELAREFIIIEKPSGVENV